MLQTNEAASWGCGRSPGAKMQAYFPSYQAVWRPQGAPGSEGSTGISGFPSDRSCPGDTLLPLPHQEREKVLKVQALFGNQ